MRILPSGGCSSTTLKPFSAVGITLDFSLHGIMYAWRNWFGSFLKSGDVAAVVTAKAFTVSNPSASSAHCCLCAVMDLWLWGGVLKSSYLGNAHGTCCCFIPVESLVGPLLLLCLRMGIALWLLQLFGGFIFSYLTYNLKNNPARFQCMSCVCRAKSLLLFGKLPSQLLITATFFPTSKYLIKLAIGFLSTFSTTNRLQICLADQLWIFLGLTQHSLLQPG